MIVTLARRVTRRCLAPAVAGLAGVCLLTSPAMAGRYACSFDITCDAKSVCGAVADPVALDLLTEGDTSGMENMGVIVSSSPLIQHPNVLLDTMALDFTEGRANARAYLAQPTQSDMRPDLTTYSVGQNGEPRALFMAVILPSNPEERARLVLRRPRYVVLREELSLEGYCRRVPA